MAARNRPEPGGRTVSRNRTSVNAGAARRQLRADIPLVVVSLAVVVLAMNLGCGQRPGRAGGGAPLSDLSADDDLFSPFGPKAAPAAEESTNQPASGGEASEAGAALNLPAAPSGEFASSPGTGGDITAMPIPQVLTINSGRIQVEDASAAQERVTMLNEAEVNELQEAINMATADPAKSIPLLEEFMRKRPDVVLPYEWIGVARNLMGEHDRALPPLDMALSMEPKRATALLQRGSAYVRLGRSERALRDLDQAAGLGLKDVGLELFRAVALLNLGRLKECEAAATRAIELGPNLPDPYYIRALARGYQRRIDEAKPDFERAVANGLDSNSQAYGRKLFGIAAPK